MECGKVGVMTKYERIKAVENVLKDWRKGVRKDWPKDVRKDVRKKNLKMPDG